MFLYKENTTLVSPCFHVLLPTKPHPRFRSTSLLLHGGFGAKMAEKKRRKVYRAGFVENKL